MSKNAYLIESLAPLVFRSGKPFGSIASAQDATFPLPSATAGLIRAKSLEQEQGKYPEYKGKLQDEAYQKLLSVKSQGPFLVRFNPEKVDEYTILVPKPSNALYFENKETKEVQLVRLAPKALDAAICGSDLPRGLVPIQMQQGLKGKPQSGVAYWTLEHFIQWQQGTALTFNEVKEHGLQSLPIDIRTHVEIDDGTLSSKDGKLFQTASLDLNHAKNLQGWNAERYGFLIFSPQILKPDLATLGGERRLSYLKPVAATEQLATLPEGLLEKINQAKGFSLSLITPSIFAKGYLPNWINEDTFEGELLNSEVKVKLEAVAIDRWLPVSGWDSIVWKPKATRKAVGAGSVYWFKLLDHIDQSTLEKLWANAIADHHQDQCDGFGVVIVSAYTPQN